MPKQAVLLKKVCICAQSTELVTSDAHYTVDNFGGLDSDSAVMGFNVGSD